MQKRTQMLGTVSNWKARGRGRARRIHVADSQGGFSLIEVMLAGLVLVVCSLGIISMVSSAIASNTRSKHDSTKTMLAEAVIEQVNSTLIGGGSANLSDCAGNNFTIDSTTGGAKLQGGGTHPNDVPGQDIDFSESSPPAGYQMNYVVTSPCSPTGQYVATYDVRWHVDKIGEKAGTPTNSFLLTVGAKSTGANSNGVTSGLYFSLPIDLRVVIGRPE